LPVVVIDTQFSFIYEITKVRRINLECWIGVTDPDAPKILLRMAQSIGREAGVFYNLQREAQRFFPYALVLLALGIVWTFTRIKILTSIPTRRVMMGSFCALVAYATLNLVYAAFAPSYAWVEPPPEPCVGLKGK
jgi:hypothetical protein